MMEESDPRVKKLQDLAWSVQSVSNKPGGKLPEADKRDAYKVTSRAIELCSDCVYMEEEDFVQKAAVLTRELEAKKLEVKEKEEAEIERLKGRCFRPSSAASGGYAVADKTDRPSSQVSQHAQAAAAMRTTQGGEERPLTAEDIVAKCRDDPEALWLADAGLTDGNVDALVEGLRRGGADLTSIDLSSNHIADAGVQKLVAALVGGACPKLTTLWLEGNSFGPLGLQMLQAGLGALRRGLSVKLDTAPSAAAGQRVATSSEPAQPAPTSGEPRPAGQAPRGEGPVGAATSSAPAQPAATAGEPRPATDARQGGGLAGVADQPGSTDPAGPTSVAAEVAEARTVAVVVEDSTEGSARLVRATIPLPDTVLSVRDVGLDVSDSALKVNLCNSGSLVESVSLPVLVDPSSTQAAFSKKKRTLTVTMHAR